MRGRSVINTGVESFWSSPVMTNVTVDVSGAQFGTVGINNLEGSFLVMKNVIIKTTGGTSTVGLTNQGYSIAKVDHSEISAQYMAINNNANIYIVNTKLDGPINHHPLGTLKCVGVYDGNYYSITCP